MIIRFFKPTTLLILLLFFIFAVEGQRKTAIQKTYRTSQYAGKYSLGTSIKKGPVGSIEVFAESDSTLLFYISLNRGAPSYNGGYLYGRVVINDGAGLYYNYSFDSTIGCKWLFQFSKNRITIETLEDGVECGFGYGVYADGTYKKTAGVRPYFLKEGGNERVYFEKTKPSD